MNIKEYISSGVIEAYVLGLATQEEVSILECIRKNNSEVEQAILDVQAILNDLATAQAIEAPPQLKDTIWNKLNTQQAIKQSIEIEEPVDEKIIPIAKNNGYWKKLAIAASALFVVSIGTTLYYQNKNVMIEQKLATAISDEQATTETLARLTERWNLLQNPNIKTITLAGVEQHPDLIAHVFWNAATAEVYLSSTNLPVVPPDMQYQLWAIVDGVPVDAGIFELKDNEGINQMLKIEKAQAFAITLEKKGGSPTPNLTQLYVMGNI